MLSTWQCTAQSRDAFTGEQELAGEAHEVDGFVRLAEGPGIHVVWTDQDTSEEIEDELKMKLKMKLKLKLKIIAEIKDKWLIMVMDSAGVAHYIEAGYLAGDTGKTTSGTTWNDSLGGVEWLPAEDSGAGVFGSPLKLIDPSSDPSDPDIYVQDFNEAKTIQVLACIDDSGNIVSAYPQDCQALGLAPPSGSCWASLGTEAINTWWG